jgi:hypothetical protein
MIESDNVVAGYDRSRLFSDIPGYQDVFAHVIPTLELVQGGCVFHKGLKDVKTISNPYFEEIRLKVELSQQNNCGIVAVNHFFCKEDKEDDKVEEEEEKPHGKRSLSTFLKFCKVKQQLGLARNAMMNPLHVAEYYSNCCSACAASQSKPLLIIDEHVKAIDTTQHNYIMCLNKHYYPVLGATKREMKTSAAAASAGGKSRISRGLLCWDVETRPTEEYCLIRGGTQQLQKSHFLKDTITSIHYRRYKHSDTHTHTFVTNKEKSSVRQFIEWLQLAALNQQFFHCYAHNGSRFDMYFWLAELTKEETKLAKLCNKGYAVIHLQYLQHTFKDTCQFMPDSLDRLCLSFKVEQGKQTTIHISDTVSMSNKELCFTNLT